MSFNKDWEEVKMKDICTITSSKRIYRSEYKEKGIPFYRSKEIIEKFNNNEISNNLFISKDRYNEISKKHDIPKKREILLTSVGTLGVPYLIKENEKFYFKDGNLTWFKDFEENILSEYVYYWLQSDLAKRQIKAITIGSTQQALTIKSLKKLDIKLPNYKLQKVICDYINSFDKKIENNNKMNKTLEEMAQTIYKNWFVDFEPFQDEEFVDSELGMIPEGWEVVPFENLFEFQKGKTPKNKSKENKDGYLKYLTISVLSGKKTLYGEPTEKNTLVNENDVIMVMDGSRSGKIFFGTSGIVASTLAKLNIINDKISNGFIYLLAKYQEKEFMKNTTGSAVPHADKKYILNKKIAIPKDKNLLNNFNKSINDIRTKISLNRQENQSLKELRDSLLPKLMSGEIRVPIEENKEV